MKQTANLTNPYSDDTQSKITSTPAGMAHWAASGPEGKTCRECNFMLKHGHYSANSKKRAGRLKPIKCAKHESMMGRPGASFEPGTPACRFFEQNPNPPALIQSNWKG